MRWWILLTLVWCWLPQGVEPLTSRLVEWAGSLLRVGQVTLVWPLRSVYTWYTVYIRVQQTRITSALHERHDKTLHVIWQPFLCHVKCYQKLPQCLGKLKCNFLFSATSCVGDITWYIAVSVALTWILGRLL